MSKYESSGKLKKQMEPLQIKLSNLEKEVDRHHLEQSRWDNERAVLQHELQETKRSESQLREELQKKILEQQRSTTADTERLMAEKERVQRQYQMVADDAQKQLNEAEVANARLVGKVAQLQRELSTKDEEVNNALRETTHMKASMERIVKELVDKTKRTEEEANRKLRDAQEEIQMLLDEHRRQASDLVEARKQQTLLKDEILALEAQIDNSKSVNQQLLREIEDLHRRGESLDAHAKEMEELERSEAETRSDLEVALAKLAKADSHIQQLSDEAAANHVTLIKLRHQAELAEDAANFIKKDKQEFVSRMTQLCDGVVDEVEKLQQEMDQGMESLHSLIAVGSSTAGAHLLRQQPIRRQAMPLRADPSQHADQQLLATAMRVRDALSVAKEDLIALHRGIVEEAVFKRDSQQKDNVIDEMLRAERAHIVELSARCADLESRLKGEEAKSVELERSLLETSGWMNEAVAVGEERTRRMNVVLEEKKVIMEKCAALQQQLDNEKQNSHVKEMEISKLQNELAMLQSDVKHQQRATLVAEDDVASLRRNITTLRSEMEAARQQAELAKNDAASSKQRAVNLETEIAFLRKQGEELQLRLRTKDQQVEQLERVSNSQKDQIFNLQTRLDQALRPGGVVGYMSGAASSQLGGTAATDYSVGVSESVRKAGRGVSPIRPSNALGTADPLSSARSGMSLGGGSTLGIGSGSGAAAAGGGDRVKEWEARIQSILLRQSS